MRDFRSTASLKGHPVHPMLVPFPIVFFLAALGTDIAFSVEGSPDWAVASQWLLGAGLAGALLAALAAFADFFGNRRVRELRDTWLHMFANLTAVVLELINFSFRLGDKDIAGSFGLAISAIVALTLLFSGWKGGELVYRHGVGQSAR